MMTPATTIETLPPSPENEWKRDRTRTPTYLYKAALELETQGREHVGARWKSPLGLDRPAHLFCTARGKDCLEEARALCTAEREKAI